MPNYIVHCLTLNELRVSSHDDIQAVTDALRILPYGGDHVIYHRVCSDEGEELQGWSTAEHVEIGWLQETMGLPSADALRHG